MSTDYYLPCEDCVHKIKHIHRASERPVAQTFESKKGVEIDHQDYLSDDALLLSQYGSLHTLAEIKDNLEKRHR